MPQLIPPEAPPPLVAVGDGDDRLKRVHFRIWQILMAAVTVLVTGYFITLGPIMAVLAIMIAKHVLVAILVQGMGIDAARGQDLPGPP